MRAGETFIRLGLYLIIGGFSLAVSHRFIASTVLTTADSSIANLTSNSAWLLRSVVGLLLLSGLCSLVLGMSGLNWPRQSIKPQVEPPQPAEEFLVLEHHPEVQAVRERLHQALLEAQHEKDERWIFDARTSLEEYLPEVLQRHQQQVQGWVKMDDRLREALHLVQQIGTQQGRTGTKARKEWEELQFFLYDRNSLSSSKTDKIKR